MRIGFDVGPITRTRTGVGQYCHYLLKHLLDIDPDDEFIGFSSGLRSIDLFGLPARLQHRHLPMPTRLVYQAWDHLRRPRVDRFLSGVDVFHATNFVVPPVARAKRVVTIHDVAFLAAPHLCSPKITRYFAANVRSYAEKADAILVHSEAAKNDLLKYLGAPPEKIQVAWPGVDATFYPVDVASASQRLMHQYNVAPPFVLYVGTLEPRKNVVGVIKAFADIKDEFPHTLVLVGQRGWNAEPIFNTIEDLNLTTRVRHVGFVLEHAGLGDFYSAADALIYPTYYEGFGLPLAEAMLCGCPIVTSNAASVPEVVGDAALTADPDDISAHARHLRAILTDPGLRDSLRMRGLDQVQKFSWKQCADTTLSLYRRLAA